MKSVAGLALVLALSGCAPVDRTPVTSIIGGTLIDGTGSAPVTESVVVVVGSRVSEAGARATVPIPKQGQNVDARGKYITPLVIDLGKAQLAAVNTNDELKKLLDIRTPAYGSLPEDIEPALVARLRDSSAVFAPALSSMAGEELARVSRQLRQLAAAGVAIGVASSGQTARELELLGQAGLSPMEVVVAATRNGALALRQSQQRGTLTVGKFANLQLLAGNPLDDVRNLARPERTMEEGSWTN